MQQFINGAIAQIDPNLLDQQAAGRTAATSAVGANGQTIFSAPTTPFFWAERSDQSSIRPITDFTKEGLASSLDFDNAPPHSLPVMEKGKYDLYISEGKGGEKRGPSAHIARDDVIDAAFAGSADVVGLIGYGGAGPALRARRLSDGAEKDFSIYDLNDGELSSWAGGSDAVLVTLYNAAGSKDINPMTSRTLPYAARGGTPITLGNSVEFGVSFSGGGTFSITNGSGVAYTIFLNARSDGETGKIAEIGSGLGTNVISDEEGVYVEPAADLAFTSEAQEAVLEHFFEAGSVFVQFSGTDTSAYKLDFQSEVGGSSGSKTITSTEDVTSVDVVQFENFLANVRKEPSGDVFITWLDKELNVTSDQLLPVGNSGIRVDKVGNGVVVSSEFGGAAVVPKNATSGKIQDLPAPTQELANVVGFKGDVWGVGGDIFAPFDIIRYDESSGWVTEFSPSENFDGDFESTGRHIAVSTEDSNSNRSVDFYDESGLVSQSSIESLRGSTDHYFIFSSQGRGPGPRIARIDNQGGIIAQDLPTINDNEFQDFRSASGDHVFYKEQDFGPLQKAKVFYKMAFSPSDSYASGIVLSGDNAGTFAVNNDGVDVEPKQGPSSTDTLKVNPDESWTGELVGVAVDWGTYTNRAERNEIQ